MELPTNLKKLYRHWNIYTKPPARKSPAGEVFSDPKILKEMLWFINERMSIWEKKILKKPLPYTEDTLLQTYRFCNILRELDKQTITFHTLLNPIRDDFPLWLLNMFYFRLVANSETIKHVGLLSFDTHHNKQFYKKLMATPRPRFGTPYVFPVSTIMRSKTPTRESFIAHYLPTVMQAIAHEIKSWKKQSVADGVAKILPLFGYNLHFLWTEVLIDSAYQYPEHIDLFGAFPVGPGSLPTLTRINPLQNPQNTLRQLVDMGLNLKLTYNKKPLYLSAENWEGIGCEFRKYSHLKQGKGRKRLYK